MNRLLFTFAIATTIALVACPSPKKDGGEGESSEGEGEAGGEGEGASLGQFGAACKSGAECSSGFCTSFHTNQPNLFDDFCSASCTTDNDCSQLGAPAFCDHAGGGSVCIPSCTQDTDCDAVFGTPGMCGHFASGNGCARPTGAQCFREADCASGTHCHRYFGVPDRGFCADQSISGLPPGASCNETGFVTQLEGLTCRNDADCVGGDVCDSAGFCVVPGAARCAAFDCAEGICAGFCKADADCSTGDRCQFFNDGSGGLQGFCEPQSGSGTVCNKESDCTVPGEHCGVAQDKTTGNEITVCRAADPGDVQIGQLCTDDPTTLDVIEPTVGCVTNLCIESQGLCTEICDQDSDCGSGQACLKIPINGGANSLGLCTGARCASDADCDLATSVCSPFTGFNDVESFCFPRIPGDLAPGAACDRDVNAGKAFTAPCFSDADCSAVAGAVCNVALRTCEGPLSELCDLGCDEFGARCSAACSADADCGTDGLCVGFAFVINQGLSDQTTAVEHLCVTAPGSRAACTKTADCTTTGEVCVALPALDGTVKTFCAQPWPDGVGVGQPCDDTGTAIKQCAEGVCAASPSVCVNLCGTNADCPTNQTCQLIPDALGTGQDARGCR